MGPLIQGYRHHRPQIHPSAYVHESAVIIGEVTLGERASVWPGVVLRGDQGAILVGDETNLQDGTIAHATGGHSRVVLGARCTVGHRVVLHGCEVEDEVLVGMGAILLDNCRVGRHSLLGAGALVPAGRRIPPRSLVLGSPGKVVRTLTDAEIEQMVMHGHSEYLTLAAAYRGEGAP